MFFNELFILWIINETFKRHVIFALLCYIIIKLVKIINHFRDKLRK